MLLIGIPLIVPPLACGRIADDTQPPDAAGADDHDARASLDASDAGDELDAAPPPLDSCHFGSRNTPNLSIECAQGGGAASSRSATRSTLTPLVTGFASGIERSSSEAAGAERARAASKSLHATQPTCARARRVSRIAVTHSTARRLPQKSSDIALRRAARCRKTNRKKLSPRERTRAPRALSLTLSLARRGELLEAHLPADFDGLLAIRHVGSRAL